MGKVAGQRVTFRASARMGAIAASLAAAAALLLPSIAFASTMIGSAVGDQPCGGPADTIQLSSSKPSYAIPTGATVITDWFVQAAANDTGSVSLLVWRPDGTGGYNLIAVGPAKNLSDSSTTFDLGGTIPVLAGDLIGLRISGDVTCYSSTTAMTSTDQFGVSFSTTPAGGSIAIDRLFSPGQLNVRATVDAASNPVVTSADECKNGGWQTLTDSLGTAFRNQGDCVSFVRTGGKNLARVTP